MKRLILILEIAVSDLDRMKNIKLAIEAQAEALPETVKIKTRYDEYPDDD